MSMLLLDPTQEVLRDCLKSLLVFLAQLYPVSTHPRLDFVWLGQKLGHVFDRDRTGREHSADAPAP